MPASCVTTGPAPWRCAACSANPPAVPAANAPPAIFAASLTVLGCKADSNWPPTFPAVDVPYNRWAPNADCASLAPPPITGTAARACKPRSNADGPLGTWSIKVPGGDVAPPGIWLNTSVEGASSQPEFLVFGCATCASGASSHLLITDSLAVLQTCLWQD